MTVLSEPVEIIRDLFQIRIPIPIRSLDYVFCYLALDGQDNLLVDSGWPSQEARKALEASLFSIGLSFSKIKKVAISHLHPDHFGLASIIQAQSPSADLIMHRADAAGIMHSQAEFDHFIDELHSWLGTHGTPPDLLEEMLSASRETLRFFDLPRPNVLIEGGESIAVGNKWNFEVLATPGHTIGMFCLFDRRSGILFSGDHILPTITPNVSLGPRYHGNPLGDYLQSLKKLKNVEASLVLPSHETVFSDSAKRIGEIERHHDERLGEALRVLGKAKGGGLSAFEIASQLRWNTGSWNALTAWDKRAALMETLAHLEYLKLTDRAVEVRDETTNTIEFHSNNN